MIDNRLKTVFVLKVYEIMKTTTYIKEHFYSLETVLGLNVTGPNVSQTESNFLFDWMCLILKATLNLSYLTLIISYGQSGYCHSWHPWNLSSVIEIPSERVTIKWRDCRYNHFAWWHSVFSNFGHDFNSCQPTDPLLRLSVYYSRWTDRIISCPS